MLSSRASSPPGGQTRVCWASAVADGLFTASATWEALSGAYMHSVKMSWKLTCHSFFRILCIGSCFFQKLKFNA